MNSLDAFHPTVRRWFEHSFDTPTPVQRASWPVIAGGEHALITVQQAAKLTAFWSLSQLLPAAETGSTKVLYVSPLRAEQRHSTKSADAADRVGRRLQHASLTGASTLWR